MRWRQQRRSTNVEDRRGMGGRGIAIGGGGIGVLVLIIAVVLCGGDPRALLEALPQQGQGDIASNTATAPVQDDESKQFTSAVLGSTEDVWNEIFRENGRNYREPTLVLFSGQVRSACGFSSSATGPFYCPADQKLYLDTDFFRELKNEFRSPGDFAQAYVIAHEVGHHVQNLLGVMEKVQRAGNTNELSVRLELQADCFAGIWAAKANEKGLVEAGDPQEAIRAAAAVGDDSIQKRTQGYVVPDSFTHGSSEERVRWFTTGFRTGDVARCETFR
ncbi:MAG: flagellar biosynthesis protein FlgM [Acidobacteria bacterium]|nr:MAG: flagellar biosynthesis protein FlgM [Acidobacteriota bacterium]REJ99363.1 MAG: flagellar biosynthesis protein FlgM [Acidobacteriota bacterium]REK16467.1 MAG: flagellar biosynthesis protein FlgM [Acidobacteriota bacterium]REK44149.1 MAG: flagellar biosynthesis protein FlgM [Acidobacteriota bacterium]